MNKKGSSVQRAEKGAPKPQILTLSVKSHLPYRVSAKPRALHRAVPYQ